jgi:hypothetical protein
LDEASYTLAKKLYEYIRVKAQEKDVFDQIDIAYISGLLEGLLVKNGFTGDPEPVKRTFMDIFKHET